MVARGARRARTGAAMDALPRTRHRRPARVQPGGRADAGDDVLAAMFLWAAAQHAGDPKWTVIVPDDKSRSKSAHPCAHFSTTARPVSDQEELHLLRRARVGRRQEHRRRSEEHTSELQSHVNL